MTKMILKGAILTMAVMLAVPESMAKRLGGGRSVGRQSQMSRQRVAPSPAPALAPRQQRPLDTAPAYAGANAARQTPVAPATPNVPTQPIQRPATSPWGGMVGGALLGLGLGSLLSPGNHDGNAATQGPGSTNNSNAESLEQRASDGRLDNYADINRDTSVKPATQQSGFGSFLFPAILALIVYIVFKRRRAKAASQQSNRMF